MRRGACLADEHVGLNDLHCGASGICHIRGGSDQLVIYLGTPATVNSVCGQRLPGC